MGSEVSKKDKWFELSTPKNEHGFFSININKGKGFWQMGENPEKFVAEKIKLAVEIFEGFPGDQKNE